MKKKYMAHCGMLDMVHVILCDTTFIPTPPPHPQKKNNNAQHFACWIEPKKKGCACDKFESYL